MEWRMIISFYSNSVLSSRHFHLKAAPRKVQMAAGLMHAVTHTRYGGGAAALKHVEIPIPSPGQGELLLKLEAVSINPVDWKIQDGMLRPFLPRKFPHIPCTDVAGEVVDVGSRVPDFKIGDKVVALLSHRNGGGLAEFCTAKATLAVRRPAGVEAGDAAGLLVAGLTAHQAVTETAGIKLDGTGARKNILITAASGGVGHYAVQLAKLGNAHVTATCGSSNADLVRSLGADEVLDYRTPQGAALASPSGKKYDIVLNCARGIPWCTFEPNLAEYGKVIDLTPGAATMLTFALKKLTLSKKQLVPFVLSGRAENMEVLVGLVASGRLRTVVDSEYPLSRAEDAWAKSVEGHSVGKIVVHP